MIWRYLISAVIAYLLGSISMGVLIARKEGHDIRNEGSHNTGASNVLRVLGLKKGALTFIGDVLKAVAAILIGRWLAGENGALIASAGVIIGHNWPVFFGFKGGKGIACSTAVVVLTYSWQGGIAIALCLLTIFLTRYISVGSMVLVTSFAVLVTITEGIWPAGVWAIALALLAIYRHRANIDRLVKGTENKLSFKKKK